MYQFDTSSSMSISTQVQGEFQEQDLLKLILMAIIL